MYCFLVSLRESQGGRYLYRAPWFNKGGAIAYLPDHWFNEACALVHLYLILCLISVALVPTYPIHVEIRIMLSLIKQIYPCLVYCLLTSSLGEGCGGNKCWRCPSWEGVAL